MPIKFPFGRHGARLSSQVVSLNASTAGSRARRIRFERFAHPDGEMPEAVERIRSKCRIDHADVVG
jgi:hypothetical protein